MKTSTLKAQAAALVLALAFTFTPPAMAQDTMQGMDMSSMQGMQTPAKKPAPKKPRHAAKHAQATPPPVPASSIGTRMPSMHGMGMSSMHGMPMQPPSSAKAAAQPAPASSASSQSMQGKDMQHMPVSQPTQPSSPATSQDASSMPGMQGMSTRPAQPVEMQHLHFGQMIGTRPKPGGLAGAMGGMSMPAMQGMDMSSMQGGNAPPDARSPDYSDGYTYGPMPGMDMADDTRHGMLLLDQLEVAHSRNGGNATFIDGEAWYGGDINKLWLKVEGGHAGGKWEDLRSEALWSHAVATYWNTQLGVRHDSGAGPGRTWAAFGIEGLAPYWFETDATFYVGQGGRTAARVQVEYELLFTQRLILQPKVEVNLYGKDDPQRGIGSGLSDLEAGLRLRYEARREFAPYVGVVWRQTFGRTADFARARGEYADDLQFIAGFRIWF